MTQTSGKNKVDDTLKIQYDKTDQLKRIQHQIMQSETLHAVYDLKGGGTGFIGITDKRLIFYDQSFIMKHRAMVTLPYTKITAVGFEDTGGLVMKSSKIFVIAGSREWSFDFRDEDKARYTYTLITHYLMHI